jgi:hypothetical protein
LATLFSLWDNAETRVNVVEEKDIQIEKLTETLMHEQNIVQKLQRECQMLQTQGNYKKVKNLCREIF